MVFPWKRVLECSTSIHQPEVTYSLTRNPNHGQVLYGRVKGPGRSPSPPPPAQPESERKGWSGRMNHLLTSSMIEPWSLRPSVERSAIQPARRGGLRISRRTDSFGANSKRWESTRQELA